MEIVRTTATAEQVANLNKLVFGATLTLPTGTELTIKSCELVAHTVDGKASKNAVAVFKCALGSGEHIIYINSLIKRRFDYNGNPLEHKGSLNLEISKLIGKTWAEAFEECKKFEGRKISALEIFYKGIDRNGDIRDMLYNEWNFVS